MISGETESRIIAFSPPDITEAEIAEVADALRSGWITTGPRTKELEGRLARFVGAAGCACLGSGTAALECALRVLGIGPGDEVIVPAYTYTATASCVSHVGATPILCDSSVGDVNFDLESLRRLVTPATKAVIPVDLGGVMAHYDLIESTLEQVSDQWSAANDVQRRFDRIPIIADAAHSLGAARQGSRSGSVADFTAFSFHAVKNFTTAEGGALVWRSGLFDDEWLYHQLMLHCLHGQSKDALSKSKAGSWEYDIEFLGHKCNMTDLQAALGLVQLDRYPHLLQRRSSMIARYEENLQDYPIEVMRHITDDSTSSGHLMITRIEGCSESQRNHVIEHMGQMGVACNVHYKPLPLMTAYKSLGWDIDDFPRAYSLYENEITLPLHTLLSNEDIDYVCACYARALEEVL